MVGFIHAYENEQNLVVIRDQLILTIKRGYQGYPTNLRPKMWELVCRCKSAAFKKGSFEKLSKMKVSEQENLQILQDLQQLKSEVGRFIYMCTDEGQQRIFLILKWVLVYDPKLKYEMPLMKLVAFVVENMETSTDQDIFFAMIHIMKILGWKEIYNDEN